MSGASARLSSSGRLSARRRCSRIEHARVAERAGPGDELERARDRGAQPRRRVGLLVDLGAQQLGAEAAVLLEERDEQVVLAGEVPVEALQVHPGARRDLRHRERGAAGLVGERAGGVDESLEAVDGAGPGRAERPGQRPVAPGIEPVDFGERHSPPVWRGRASPDAVG